MKKLAFHSVDNINLFSKPHSVEPVTLDSSALEVFTDFKQIEPLVIEADTKAVDAQAYMRKAHVRMKLVVDKQEHFLGVISLDDLTSQEIMKHMSKVDKREDLLVTEFMRPRGSLHAFSYADLEKASIMDVIQVLKTTGQQHCLVVDYNENTIRGIISASDISRKLHLPLDIETNSSFVSIFNVLHH